MRQTNTFIYRNTSSYSKVVFALTESTIQSENGDPITFAANNSGQHFLYKKVTDSTLVLSNANTTVVANNGDITQLNMFPVGECANVTSSNGTTVLALFQPLMNYQFANINLIDIVSSYQLEPNTYAVVVEGSVNATSTHEFYTQHNDIPDLIADGTYVADSANGYHCIKASPNNITLVGTGKLITFNISNG